ncbi:MAG: thiamine pyrophosphate-dependent enzyme, partial [Acidobacteriota bacterium]|nr:thiamine pyrophosphate-dependent enzyme [Acidobacteriota bacterium]
MEQEAETRENQDPGDRADRGRETVPGGLTELYGFLSLEAPDLNPRLADLPTSGSDEDLETALLAEIETLYQPHEDLAGQPLYPSVDHEKAVSWRRADLEVLVAGFFERRRIKASITPAERLEMFRAMLLTRLVDDRLKAAFGDAKVEWQGYVSPQKGFRSTGQEAIVGAALRLRRPGNGATAASSETGPEDYDGDVISPLIRDLGALLMFMPDPLHPLLVQAGKAGTPVGGRDLHAGDFGQGVLPPAAPLAIAAQTLVGVAYGFKLRRQDRVCVAFIGDGGSSLGEWHEAVNFAAVQGLNVVFVVENNQWALGTHVSEQSACHRFALKATGYGIPGVTLFGNDPDEVAAGVSWAAERARRGEGPALVELVTYRRSGHAHHDDDRFHGSEAARVAGYEFGAEAEVWRAHDPIDLYGNRLVQLGVVRAQEIEAITLEIEREVASAVETVRRAPWPEQDSYLRRVEAKRTTPVAEAAPEAALDPKRLKKMSYDEAVRQALIETMEADPEVFVLGEDVGGRYGGAFGVTRGLAKRFGAERCLNTPLAESAIVGCGVGAALLGLKPVVEMQFADFLAPGF